MPNTKSNSNNITIQQINNINIVKGLKSEREPTTFIRQDMPIEDSHSFGLQRDNHIRDRLIES